MEEGTLENGGRLKLEIAIGGASFAAEGDSGVVLQAFERFQEYLAKAPAVAAGMGEQRGRGAAIVEEAGEAEAEAATLNAAQTDTPPLNVFITGFKELKSKSQIATAIVYWAKKYGSQAELSPDAVKNLWRGTTHKVPANVARDMGKAAKEGWLTRLGSGRYAITGHGERYIDGLATKSD